jgi:tripartite-type tricarboxylate transporter receptor subunit TctC
MVRLLFGCIALVASAASASAQVSGKPIKVVVPVAAGAATDILGRMAADWIGRETGRTVIVENRTGAGGTIALESVAREEPDGNTLLIATNGAITISPALKTSAVAPLTDVVPVAPLAWFPNILVVNSKVPAKTAPEFIALAKAKPGAINYGSAGPGSTPHLGMALFAKLAGIDIVHVPYRGMAPAMTDLLAGNVQAVVLGYGTVAPHVREGSLRILAVAGPERLSYLPDVPTAAEIGLPEWQVETWWGLFAPRGTPKPIVDAFNRYIRKMLDDPANSKRFADSFYDSMRLSADAFAARVKADAAKWQRVVQQTGIKTQ